MGGDTTRICVKYKKYQPLQGTPIIISTNNHLNIINDPTFKDCVTTYHWSAAPFLKKIYKLRSNPLFFFQLLVQWNVVENNKTIAAIKE